eukprot:PITA_06002
MSEIPDSTEFEKCIFCVPFGIWLDHVVCKQGLMVDPTNIAVVVNLEAPSSIKQLRMMLGHTGYYRKVIKAYTQNIAPMEKLLKKDVTFCWDEECQHSLDVLKEKMVTMPILVFPYWKRELHVHVDASCIALGAVLTQVGEGEMDHPIAFASRKLSKAKKNYSKTECKGLAMVNTLQKFRHYLLGGHFKMYTDHFALTYLVNKPVLGGKICRWLLLFQEYDFEVIVKSRQLNARPDHLSRIETSEEPSNLEEGMPNAQLFAVCVANDYCADIIHFFNYRDGAGRVYHQKSTPYHPWENGTIEDFNKILENELTNICNAQLNDWDVCVPIVLWAYRTTCNKLTGQMSFRLVYGVEAVMPMEYIVPSLHITNLTDMADHEALEEWLVQLMELEEDRFLAGFHQQVQKECKKAWHDRHIKLRTFKVNDIVLLYNGKFTKFLGKCQMH